MKPGAVGVAMVALLLAAGGLFFGLGGVSGGSSGPDSVPKATLPPVTVAPPPPAVIGSELVPAATFPEGTETLPVPNVIGVNLATAEARLANFDVEVATVTATDAEFFDAVTAQRPAAAERLPAGGSVSITFSLQPTPETIPADPVPVGEFSVVNMTELEEGDCGNGAASDGVLVYERVDCDDFHDVQLIQRFDVENGPDEYDADELSDLVREQCQEPFRDFVGVDPQDSKLFLQIVRPNDVRYGSERERLSLCVLYPSSTSRLRGSAEGTLW